MIAAKVNEKITLIPVSCDIKHSSVSDCKMIIFSQLLHHYGIDYSPAEIILAGSGLEFDLYNYKVSEQKCFLVIGRSMTLEDEFSKNINLKLHKQKYILSDNFESEKEECKNDIINVLKEGQPVCVNTDRFYLTYLDLKPAHMPYHAILLVGYNWDNDVFIAIDSLKEGYVEISAELLIKSMFETGVLKEKAEAEWFYIKEEDISLIKEPNYVEAIINQAQRYSSEEGGLFNLINTISFLENMLKMSVEAGNRHYFSYMKYQITMMYTQFEALDIQKFFYRKLYFEQSKLCLSEVIPASIKRRKLYKLMDSDISLWGELASPNHIGEKVDLKKGKSLLKQLKKIYSVEVKIFNLLKELLVEIK